MFQRFVSMVASGAPPPPVSAEDRRPAKERGVLSPAVAVGSESLHVFRRHGAVERVMAHVSGVRHFEATWYTSADTEALAAITAVDEVLRADEDALDLIERLVACRQEAASVGTVVTIFPMSARWDLAGCGRLRWLLPDLRLVTLDHWAMFLCMYTAFGNGTHGREVPAGPAVRGCERHVLGKGHLFLFLRAARSGLAALPNLRYFLFKWRHARRLDTAWSMSFARPTSARTPPRIRSSGSSRGRQTCASTAARTRRCSMPVTGCGTRRFRSMRRRRSSPRTLAASPARVYRRRTVPTRSSCGR